VDRKAQLLELQGSWRYRGHVYAIRTFLVCFLSLIAVPPISHLFGLSLAATQPIVTALLAVAMCSVLGVAIFGTAINQRYGGMLVYERYSFARGIIRDILRYRKPGK
jgi:hypothetical protein